jgi:hypothetical protein
VLERNRAWLAERKSPLKRELRSLKREQRPLKRGQLRPRGRAVERRVARV